MMKNIKILTIITMLMLSLVMIINEKNEYDNNNKINLLKHENDNTRIIETSNETINEEIGEETLYTIDLQINGLPSQELIQSMASKKNKECEIAYNPNGYERMEFSKVVLPTTVKITTIFTNERHSTPTATFATGNIFDITNDYIYILSTAHQYYENTSLANGDDEAKIYEIDIIEIRLKFITGEEIIITTDCLYRTQYGDISLIKIEKDALSTETLNMIKSINIDNALDISIDYLENDSFYCYCFDKDSYKVASMSNFEFKSGTSDVYSLFAKISTIQGGFSGGGIFDKYGTYHGYVIMRETLPIMFNYIDDILVVSGWYEDK